MDNKMTYDCHNEGHENGIDLPDELFPTVEQTKAGMDPEICVNCQLMEG